MNEKNNKEVIAMAIYRFSGYGMEAKEYPIINETEKSYVVMKENNSKSIISKEKVGKATHHMCDSFPYVRVYLYNATGLDAREELAKWFETEASYIRKERR
jgi:hypothetical protein